MTAIPELPCTMVVLPNPGSNHTPGATSCRSPTRKEGMETGALYSGTEPMLARGAAAAAGSIQRWMGSITGVGGGRLRRARWGRDGAMPDFEDIEQEARSHGKEVDEGIDKAQQFADKEAAGRDRGLIDKAAGEAEKAAGGDQPQPQPPSSS